jgi:hypothetical protein
MKARGDSAPGDFSDGSSKFESQRAGHAQPVQRRIEVPT